MNVGVLVSLGILIALFLARPAWGRVLLIAFTISLAIELMQLAAQAFFAGGHIADINDLLCNRVGAAIGFGIFTMLSRAPTTRGLIDRFRWND